MSDLNTYSNQVENNRLAQSFDELDVDLRRLLMLVWRRKWIIVAIVFISMVLAVVLTNAMSEKYTAQSYIMIEDERLNHQGIDLQNFMSNIRLDTTLVLSEVEVIKSREVARKVVERLGLMPTNVRSLTDTQGSKSLEFKPLSVYKTEMNKQPEQVLNADIASAINVFQKGLSVKPVPGSYVLQISYTSKDPRQAALIANTIADVFIEQRLEEKFKATQKVTNWLDGRLKTLRNQVRASEEAVEEYRARNNLVSGTRFEMSAQQLSEINSQIVLAKSRKAEAEARLKDIDGWLRNANGADGSPDVLKARFIQDLKKTETDILRRKAELQTRYGPKHPSILDVNAELKNIRANLQKEIDKVANSVKSELVVAESRVEGLQAQLGQMEGKRAGVNEAMIKLRELEREAESNRLIFDNFLGTYKKSDQQEELEEAEARIISYASIPEKASYPNKPLIISLTAAIALFVGITLILLLEKLDNAFRSASQLEKRTKYPCFGLVPTATGVGKGGIGDYVLNKPSSAVTESIRSLRVVLNLRAKQEKNKKPKVVTITSSLPSEGKSTLSTWLARVSAKSGEKVIVIDCDLRRPNLHKIIRKDNNVTIVDYLAGNAKLEDVIVKDEASGAHMIYAKSVPNSALDLVSSKKMATLIESLKKAYDLVILDTPACLAVSDARHLANESDFTLYLVEWDKTPREVVTTGVKQFSDFGYNNLAFVLSSVDVKRHAQYGYGDTAYYYGRFKEYYQN